MNRRHLYLAGPLAALALALAGCGGGGNGASGSPASSTSPSSSSSSSAGGSPAQQQAVITIKSFKFSGPGSVQAGEKITVKNEDPEAHTVTADKGSMFDVKVLPGKTATFTAPSAAGSYAYHCTYHSNMHGSLKVS